MQFILLFCLTISVAAFESFDYKDSLDLNQVWFSGGVESLPPTMTGGLQGKPIGLFSAPMSQLEGWRLHWDRKVKLDMSKSDRLEITIRAENPSAIASGCVYVKSGKGWFRFNNFGIDQSFKTVTLMKVDATSEGGPSGWHAIDTIRFALLPGAKIDTKVYIADIRLANGWEVKDIGKVGEYSNWTEAKAGLIQKAQGAKNAKEVLKRIQKAEALHTALLVEKDLYTEEPQKKILLAQRYLQEAKALLHQPKENEIRAMWFHYGDGALKMANGRLPWRVTMPILRKHGFNTVIPNVLWSGVAYYPSDLVPNSSIVAQDGDQMKLIVKYGRENNMKIHAWKVMFQFAENWLAPGTVVDPYLKAQRMQVDDKGKQTKALTPCLAENVEYEVKAFEEVVTRYDIDGIHLDYIRFLGANVDYHPACQKPFEEWSKETVATWPKDVLKEGKLHAAYEKFKLELITQVMRTSYKRIKAINPKLQVSAAVFSNPTHAKQFVYQDWAAWIEEGIIDWIAPMNYSTSVEQFTNTMAAAISVNKKNIPIVMGMTAVTGAKKAQSLDVLVDQIEAVRAAGLPGFALFEGNQYFFRYNLPFLGAGITHQKGNKAFRSPATKHFFDMAYPKKPKKGIAIEVKDTLKFESFDKYAGANMLGGRWSIATDGSSSGTKIKREFFTKESGASYATIIGTMGVSKPPAIWAYASLCSPLNKDFKSVDISGYTKIKFRARGNQEPYLILLQKNIVSDYAHFRKEFLISPEWKSYEFSLGEFGQPSWAEQQLPLFTDVTHFCFSPKGSNGESVDLQIDDIKFIK